LDVISPLVAQLLARQALAGFPEFAHFGFQSLDQGRKEGDGSVARVVMRGGCAWTIVGESHPLRS
jgi:hypothetical protein